MLKINKSKTTLNELRNLFKTLKSSNICFKAYSQIFLLNFKIALFLVKEQSSKIQAWLS
jgi:hypothetical protein